MVQKAFQRGITRKLYNENTSLKKEQNIYKKVVGQSVIAEDTKRDPRWSGLEKSWLGYKVAKNNTGNTGIKKRGSIDLEKEIEREKEYAALIQKYCRLMKIEEPSFDLDLSDIEFKHIKKKYIEEEE